MATVRSLSKLLSHPRAPFALYMAAWTLFFSLFWSRAIVLTPAGDITVGHVGMWGDWAIHFTMGAAMAYRDLFLVSNPLIIDSTFQYPFVANLVSALLVRAGVSFFSAFTAPSFVFSLATVASLYFFFRRVLSSRRMAVAASLLFLLNGGLGFVEFIGDIAGSPTPLKTLLFPPQMYTRSEVYEWINVVYSMMVPQRSFQMGFPMALLLLGALQHRWGPRMFAWSSPPRPWSTSPLVPIGLGLLLGVLPLVHAHAFAAAASLTGVIFLYALGTGAPRRPVLRWWAYFGFGFLLTFAPSAFYYLSGENHLSGFRWLPGWYASVKGRTWLAFWWDNWGVTPWVALAGFLWTLSTGRRHVAAGLTFFTPFLAMFAASNLFVFHPWIWDNTKVLVWASVGFCAMAAVGLRALWQAPRRAASRSAAVVLFVGMTASGLIDVYRLSLPGLDRHTLYSREDMELAEWTRKATPVESIWLTGDYHNHWLFNLTGRQTLMAYPGWLWTHGYDYARVSDDVRTMYRDPGRLDLFRRYKVEYVTVGWFERESLSADPAAFAQQFELVKETERWKIFRVSGVPGASPEPVVSSTGPRAATLPMGVALRSGLVRKEFRGEYFAGESLVKEADLRMNFRYDTEEMKPFRSPVSIEWLGFFRADVPGRYTFRLASDDGSLLSIGDQLLIDNGGRHLLKEATAAVELERGFHRLRLRYFDGGGGAVLQFGWTTSGDSAFEFEPDALYH